MEKLGEEEKSLKETLKKGKDNYEPGRFVLVVHTSPGSAVSYKSAVDAFCEQHKDMRKEIDTLIEKYTKPAPKTKVDVILTPASE